MTIKKYFNKVTIITVSKSDSNNLATTLRSISEQNCNDYRIILVVAGYAEGEVEELLANVKLKRSKIIFDDGIGIFDAMNTGLLNCETEYAIFLNGGDCFYDKMSMSVIVGHIAQNDKAKNIAFSVLQSYGSDNYIRLAKHKNRWFDFRYFPPPHQGFVAKVDRLNLFDLSDGNSADTFWIKRQIELRGCHYVSEEIVAKFRLGGISNNPLLFSKSDLPLRRLYRLVKYSIAKVIGLNNYYKVMCLIAGFKQLPN